jgi:hypothetical protein
LEKENLLQKLEEIKAKYESTIGEVTDIWLSDDLIQILDEREPIDRLNTPFMLGETYITHFRPLLPNQIRVAFLTTIEVD